jgi:hypothetical protein
LIIQIIGNNNKKGIITHTNAMILDGHKVTRFYDLPTLEALIKQRIFRKYDRSSAEYTDQIVFFEALDFIYTRPRDRLNFITKVAKYRPYFFLLYARHYGINKGHTQIKLKNVTNLFHLALLYSDFEVALMILQTGYDINTPLKVEYCYDGYICCHWTSITKSMYVSPLSYCIMARNFEGSKFLMGESALSKSVTQTYTGFEIKKISVIYPVECIDYNLKDSFGINPLLWACAAQSQLMHCNENDNIISELIKKTIIKYNKDIVLAPYHASMTILLCGIKCSHSQNKGLVFKQINHNFYFDMDFPHYYESVFHAKKMRYGTIAEYIAEVMYDGWRMAYVNRYPGGHSYHLRGTVDSKDYIIPEKEYNKGKKIYTINGPILSA